MAALTTERTLRAPKTAITAGLLARAREIVAGQDPFQDLDDSKKKQWLDALVKKIHPSDGPGTNSKHRRTEVLARSAAATSLLSLAESSKGDARIRALDAYVAAMQKEPSLPLASSMLINLDQAKLSLSAASAQIAAGVRARILPPSLPYETWFSGTKHVLNVRHYVMDEFWRANVATYKRRGFDVESESATRLVLSKELVDPSDANKKVTAKVTLIKEDTNIFRDVNDPHVQMIIYSGHSQLGGIVETSLVTAPKQMAGDKAIVLFNCRGRQTDGDLVARWPGVQLTSTDSSAYDDDDQKMLTAFYDMIAKRAPYSELRKSLRGQDLIAGIKNYILPDDPRLLAARDEDQDGFPNLGPKGPDKFFDPREHHPHGAATDFKAHAGVDPATLSGEKVSRAIGYANTSFYYFAESNRSAPITLSQADRFVPDGWFESKGDEPVKISEVSENGSTYYKVAINSKYSSQSSDALAMITIAELYAHLARKFNGKYSEQDRLRTVMLAGEYVGLYVEYKDDCDALLASFGKRYGLRGLSWDVIDRAQTKDGEDLMGSPAALASLVKSGVTWEGTVGRKRRTNES